MKKCPNCSKELSDGAKFCDECGTRIPEVDGFAECMESAAEDVSEVGVSAECMELAAEDVSEEFCIESESTDFIDSTNSTEVVVVEEQTGEAAVKKPKLKIPKKAIMFGGIGAALIAVIIIAVSMFSGGENTSKSQNNYALFIQDRELFFSDLKEESKPWQLTTRLFELDEAELEFDDGDLADSFGDDLGETCCMSKDGKYIFYLDKIGEDYWSFYCRDITDPEAGANKIGSNIEAYTVNDSATLVTCLESGENLLYQYNISDDFKEKIASNVNEFRVSDNGETIIYRNWEGGLYYKSSGQEQEKLASDITSLAHVTEDFSTVYYIKDEALYKQIIGQEKEKIASNAYLVLNVYDSGEIYYVTRDTVMMSLMDFVTDDMKKEDASIREPEEPDYPKTPSYWDYSFSSEYYDAYDEYKEEYNRLNNKYRDALEKYREKEERDQLRYNLEVYEIPYYVYTLHYLDSDTDIAVGSFNSRDYYIYGNSDYVIASEAPVVSYVTYDLEDIHKMKLSEIGDVYDVESAVRDIWNTDGERYIAAKDESKLIEREEEAAFELNESGTLAYYISDLANGAEKGELYRLSITDGIIGTPEVYDSDVSGRMSGFISDSQYKYFKDYNVNKGTGDLYVDKTRIDYDVEVWETEVGSVPGTLFYFTDWNDDKKYGTLKYYNGDESVKISDDTSDYTMVPDGRILYLYDYSQNYFKGELREWSNGETRKIADDVTCLVSVVDGTYREY